MTPDLRFTCPRCGSSSFGSSIDGPDPEGPMTRLCHGIVGNRNCGFWWPQKDDWRYFAVDGRRLGRKEYDQAQKRLRDLSEIHRRQNRAEHAFRRLMENPDFWDGFGLPGPRRQDWRPGR